MDISGIADHVRLWSDPRKFILAFEDFFGSRNELPFESQCSNGWLSFLEPSSTSAAEEV